MDRLAEFSNRSGRRPWPQLSCRASLAIRPARKLRRDRLVRNARPRERGRLWCRRRPARVIDHVSAIGSKPIECSFYLRFRGAGRRRQTVQIRERSILRRRRAIERRSHGEADQDDALRNAAVRPGHFCRCERNAARGSRTGLRRSGLARFAARSHVGAKGRVEEGNSNQELTDPQYGSLPGRAK
jgi:hypothetical protein